MRALVFAGVILLVLGGYSLYQGLNPHQYQSTFNVLAGKFLKIMANLRDQTHITGTFQETSGRPVNFTIFNSVQFANYQVNQPTANLYSLHDVPSASVDFTSTVPDTYYLVFSHGAGYLNITETVSFSRSYTSVDLTAYAVSGVLFALGAVELVWGIRSGRSVRRNSGYAAAADYPPPPRS